MILCYHDVDDGWVSPLAIHPRRFADHCAWLADSGRVVLLDQVLQQRDPAAIAGDPRLALTFDDGLAGVHEHALPLLAEHALPATVYVVAGTLATAGRPVDWIDGQRPGTVQAMTETQIRELLDAGIQIGSHTWRHADLTSLDPVECREDLRRSREFLEDTFGVAVATVAYPRGRNNVVVRRLAREAGYSFGLGLPETPEPFDCWGVPRTGIYAANGTRALSVKASPLFFRLRMSPLYPMARAVVRRLS